MSKTYDFEEQLAIGKKGEKILDKFFKKELDVDIKPATLSQELCMGFDRIFTSKKSNKHCAIEYKYDETGVKTGNIFMEILSNSSNGKKGWVLTCQAYRVMILVGTTIYSLKMKELKEYIENEGSNYREGIGPNKTYHSVGKLMPIKDLNKLESLITYKIDE